MKSLIALFSALISVSSLANTYDCQNLYVGRIWIEGGSGGLYAAVFLNNPSDTSGSWWVYFNSWSPDEKKSVLAMLTAAKLAQHRVNVATTEAGECGIQTYSTTGKSVYLATNP